MKTIILKKIIPSLFGFAAFFLLFTLLGLIKLGNPEGNLSWFVSEINGKIIESKLAEFPLLINNKNISSFKIFAEIKDCKYDSLIVPEIDAGAMVIYIDGFLISVSGDTKNYTGVLYPKAEIIPLDCYKKFKLLEIEVMGYNCTEIHNAPFLANRDEMLTKIQIHNFIKSDFTNATVAIVFIMGIVMIFISFAFDEIRKSYQMLGLALLFSSFFLVNRVYTLSWGEISFYLSLKKAFYISSHLCVYFLLYGIELVVYKTNKISKYFIYLQLFSIIILILQSDLSYFINMVNYTNVINFIGISITLFLILYSKGTKQMFTLVFLSCVLFHDMMVNVLNKDQMYLNGIGQFAGIMGIGFFLVTNIRKIRMDKENAIKKSLKDPLTGIFNRNILDEINYNTSDYVVLMDLDNLKFVNDNYGHKEGDKLILDFVRILRTHIRNEDIVIRIGGDEFICIFRNCKRKNVLRIITRVKDEFYISSFRNLGNFSYGITKYRGNILEDISRADNKMYEMKREKQNLIKKR